MAPPACTPAPNATVIPTGRLRARPWLRFALVLILIGIGGLAVLVAITNGSHQTRSSAAGLAAAGMLVTLGALGAALIMPAWRMRRTSVLVDHVGLWLDQGNRRNVIPWHTLAGIGLFSSVGNKTRFYSLELYPTGPIDRDDPVLWALVRDEAPFRAGLPHRRYRLRLTSPELGPVVTAVRWYVPHLWLGESPRGRRHLGSPDRSGHRERARGRS